jgi:hypothetical protein
LPAISFVGEWISNTDFGAVIRDQQTNEVRSTLEPKYLTIDKTVIQWFSGGNMHRALSIAAKRGFEDVKSLLLVAGNDLSCLDRMSSISQLISRMSLGA